MLKRLLHKLTGPSVRPEDLTFEQAIQTLARASEEARAGVAGRSGDAEVLEYLSGDVQPAIRALVARNPAAPRAVDAALAEDAADEVRLELASKISRLLPDLDEGAAAELREMTLKVLDRLAHDHLPRVRQIVAEEIKSSDRVPKPIVDDLARDAEAAVAAPILEFSPLLSDQDLKEVIATSQAAGVLEAVARRKNLSEDVSDAVVASLDIPAVAALLANPSAKVRAETLETIADHAEMIEAWHEGLALRPDLSVRAVRRIAGFVAVSLLMRLSERHGLDDETRRDLQVKVKERIDSEEGLSVSDDAHERARQAVIEAHSAGALDDGYIVDALKADDRLRATLALAVLARVPEGVVERVLRTRNGNVITAFAWYAGLSMRTAFLLQKDLARVPVSALVPARGGTDYPLEPDFMSGQLEVFGIQPR